MTGTGTFWEAGACASRFRCWLRVRLRPRGQLSDPSSLHFGLAPKR
jgi:hypothetical protein